MRTTLAIDDDVLIAAKAIALQRRKPLGEIISELARNALRRSPAPQVRNGVPLLPLSNPGAVVTTDHVNTLRDELP